MKKGTIAILAVAIIGALGVYGKNPGAAAHTSSASGNSSKQVKSATSQSGSYKDGTFTGNNEITPYGPVQIAVIISGGKISDVTFLQMPSDRGHTQEVTAFSEPLLKEAAIRNQSASIDFVSGATSTSEGYQQSLQSALDRAAQGSSANSAAGTVKTVPSSSSQSSSGAGGFFGEDD